MSSRPGAASSDSDADDDAFVMSALSAFVIFMLTSAGTVLFSGLGVALLGVGAHAAARVPDDLFVEDANDNKGFFSFLEPPSRNGQVSSGTV